MSEQSPKPILDEQHRTTAVYYDANSGQFCRLTEGEGTVCLLDPDTGDIFHEIPADRWPEVSSHFHPVPDHVVDDPVAHVEAVLERMESHLDPEIPYQYARERIEIVET